MDIKKHLSTVIFPAAVKAGGFGDDVQKFIGFTANDREATGSFCSIPVFGEVILEKKKTCERFAQPVLVKAQSSAQFPPQEFSDIMFHNEVLFYTKIMPSLRKYDKCDILSTSFPEFVYGKATKGQDPPENILVLKDLHEKGFKPCSNPTELDEQHIDLALDRLGKFHALSYMWKMEDPAGYEEIVSQIQGGKYANGVAVFGGIVSKEAFRECMFRGIEPLRKEPKYQDRMADLRANCHNAYDWLDKYGSSACCEPLSVINHGDFHIYNMIFRYQADGTPVEVAFFDFAVMRNGPPAVDLSMFLFFSVTPDRIRHRWNHLIRVYTEALSTQMGDREGKPSPESLELDLRTKGIYAYYLQAICTPWGISRNNGDTVLPPPKLEGLDENQSQKMLEAYMQNLRERGGARATEILSEFVRLMIDMDFIFEH